MSSRTFATAIVATALVALVAPSASAQHAGPGSPRSARVVATYEFGAGRSLQAFPLRVVVADSAGVLTASAVIPGETETLPMTVTPMESDLVLQGETPEGVLTLVLEQQNKGGSERLTSGRWILGSVEGSLRGRTNR
jgi:hypothetical protein